jgi:hypothetical protein
MMKRRDFLKAAAGAPFFIHNLYPNQVPARTKYYPGNEKSFEILEIKGSYAQIGYQIGKVFGNHIKKLIERRSKWHYSLLEILGAKEGKLKSQEYLDLTRKHFPHLVKEIEGMAEGAGLHFNAVWALCIKSELLAVDTEPSDCSTIYFGDSKRQWLFHNEDGHAAFAGIMFVLKVYPPSGIKYVSMVYPGTITGNGPGMNNKGIIQATNYIGSTESAIGIPRYILGRAVLEANNIKEAMDIVTLELRAYPYHHNICSLLQNRYVSLETTPDHWQAREPKGIYYHTNHLLLEKTRQYLFEDIPYKMSSSISRFQVIQSKIQNLNLKELSPVDIIQILALHRNAPFSPCRHPQGEVLGTTLGSAFFDIGRGRFRLFKGNPCEALENNRYVDFYFDKI